MGVEAQTILMIIVVCMGCGWLCKGVWDRPTWVIGRGSIILLAGALGYLLLYSIFTT